MADLTIPDEAREAHRRVLVQWGLEPGNGDNDALRAAAPLIVAAVFEKLADQFDLDGREADDRVRGHEDAGNGTGAAIAVVTAEIYEAVAERLREQASELRGA